MKLVMMEGVMTVLRLRLRPFLPVTVKTFGYENCKVWEHFDEAIVL